MVGTITEQEDCHSIWAVNYSSFGISWPPMAWRLGTSLHLYNPCCFENSELGKEPKINAKHHEASWDRSCSPFRYFCRKVLWFSFSSKLVQTSVMCKRKGPGCVEFKYSGEKSVLRLRKSQFKMNHPCESTGCLSARYNSCPNLKWKFLSQSSGKQNWNGICSWAYRPAELGDKAS